MIDLLSMDLTFGVVTAMSIDVNKWQKEIRIRATFPEQV